MGGKKKINLRLSNESRVICHPHEMIRRTPRKRESARLYTKIIKSYIESLPSTCTYSVVATSWTTYINSTNEILMRAWWARKRNACATGHTDVELQHKRRGMCARELMVAAQEKTHGFVIGCDMRVRSLFTTVCESEREKINSKAVTKELFFFTG
jgi:uncharacterized protein (DUF3084 family)